MRFIYIEIIMNLYLYIVYIDTLMSIFILLCTLVHRDDLNFTLFSASTYTYLFSIYHRNRTRLFWTAHNNARTSCPGDLRRPPPPLSTRTPKVSGAGSSHTERGGSSSGRGLSRGGRGGGRPDSMCGLLQVRGVC